jgi:hypothetical protein
MGAKLTSKITDHLKQKETFNRGFIPIFCDQKKKKKKKKGQKQREPVTESKKHQ